MILVEIFLVIWILAAFLEVGRGVLEILVGVLGLIILTPVVAVVKLNKLIRKITLGK
jgi:hypothetical protein